MLTATGALVGFGGALTGTVSTPTSPVVGIAATADGHGAWEAEANGTVVALGDAVYHGSGAGSSMAGPVVGIAADLVTGGYWLVASNGAVSGFDAPFVGSTATIALNQPIVGMAATPDGGGYWLVAGDGGIFAFGDARFFGSTGAMRLNQPIVGMAATPDGGGYWLVAGDGGIFAFGDARFFGSTGAMRLNQPIVGMAATPGGAGYWLVAGDGGIFAYGDAPFFGSDAGSGQRVVAVAVEDGGYRNPLRAVADLHAQRIDQGVDYSGAGPVYALGDGVVTNTTNTGWPGGAFISYRLTDGPAAGRYVYVAENVVPKVTVGQVVTTQTVLGILIDAAPDMETGWANPPGLGDAAAGAAGQWSASTDAMSLPTAYGENFSQLMAALGAPAGIASGTAVGTLPAQWPTW
jgi:hypothetical protein